MPDLPIATTAVDMQLSLVPAAPSEPGFGVYMMVVQDEASVPHGTILTYGSLAEVAEDWLSTDEVYLAALAYFSQLPRPRSFAVGGWELIETTEAVEALEKLAQSQEEWYFFGFTNVVQDAFDDADTLLIAAWTQTVVKEYFLRTTDANCTISGNEDNIRFKLVTAQASRTWLHYSTTSTEYPAVSVAARAATVNFNVPDSTLTLKFKNLPGITPENLGTQEYNTLMDGANAFIRTGGIFMISEGRMADGSTFQDTIHGTDWLQSAIEYGILGYFLRENKVPLTDAGMAGIEQQVQVPLAQGVRNGLIADSGYDFDGNFYPLGWSTEAQPVVELTPAQRQSRTASTISFVAIGGSAVHYAVIRGSFEA